MPYRTTLNEIIQRDGTNGDFNPAIAATQSLFMKSCIYLDFDGVLHPTSASREQYFCRLSFLEEVLNGHACEIVISSSWRHHYEISQLMRHFPLSLRGKIAGTTGGPFIGKWPRYQEIISHSYAHGHPAWRALDDASLEFPKHCSELILCNPNVGLDRPQLIALTQWLQRQDNDAVNFN